MSEKEVNALIEGGEELCEPSVEFECFKEKFPNWLARLGKLDASKRRAVWQHKRQNTSAMGQDDDATSPILPTESFILKCKLDRKFDELVEKLNKEIKEGAGDPFKAREEINQLICMDRSWRGYTNDTHPIYKSDCTTLSHSWRGRKKQADSEKNGLQAAAAKEAFLYNYVCAGTESRTGDGKTYEYGLECLRKGAVSGQHLSGYCGRILDAAKKAQISPTESLQMVLDALSQGIDALGQNEIRASDISIYQGVDNEMRLRLDKLHQKPSGPSGGGGGGGGTNYAGNLTPPKEARAGAGWTL